jgi:hypothetical protein
MEKFNVDENKLIRTINEELQKKFPYLLIFFFTPEIWEAQKKSGKKGFISGSEKLADVKIKKLNIYKKISAVGSTEIGVLENSLIGQLGLNCQIGCSKKQGEFQYTNKQGDKRTLEEFNKELEKAGYIKNPKPDSYELNDESASRENRKISYNYMSMLS